MLPSCVRTPRAVRPRPGRRPKRSCAGGRARDFRTRSTHACAALRSASHPCARPVSGLASVGRTPGGLPKRAAPSQVDFTQWLHGRSLLADRCGGSAGIGRGRPPASPASRWTRGPGRTAGTWCKPGHG